MGTKKKQEPVKYIKEDEFKDFISLAASMCKEKNIDVNKVVGEININNCNK